MSYYPECTEACAAMPVCRVCGKRKRPIGRDPGAGGPDYCNPVECHGSIEPPRAGHLWPSEWKDEMEARRGEMTA